MERIKVCYINGAGTEAIRAFLKKHHKNYNHIYTHNHLHEWEREAQSKWENAGVCSIEIPDTQSVTGRTVVFDLPDDCYSIHSIDDKGNIIWS